MAEFEISGDRLLVSDPLTSKELDYPIDSEGGQKLIEVLVKETGRTPRGVVRILRKIGPKEL